MTIFAASDLHYGSRRAGDRAVRALADEVGAASEDDVLLLGGDLAEGEAKLRECLALFERFRGPRLAIPGNHDIWVEGDETSSWARYERLPRVFREHGFTALEDGPFAHGGVTYVGALGWYDYSFRDDLGIPDEAYESKIYPGMTHSLWRDATRARWGESDRAFCDRQVERLAASLAAAPADRPIVALVHHVPTKALLVHPRALVPRFFRFVNAFLGSERLGDLLARDPRVRLVVSGHIHRRGLARKRDATFVSIGGDYRRKELVRLAVEPIAIERETILDPGDDGVAETTA